MQPGSSTSRGARRLRGPALSCFPSFRCAAIRRATWSSDHLLSRAITKLSSVLRARLAASRVICGLVTPADADAGKSVMNSAALLMEGKVAFTQSKMLLPTYDVFDEMRNFAPAKKQDLFSFCGNRMALTICEDAWNDKQFWRKRLYTVDPVETLIEEGGNFVLNISASPFWIGKREFRRDMLASIARQHKVPVALVNQVGGNDSLVFDGSSLVSNR